MFLLACNHNWSRVWKMRDENYSYQTCLECGAKRVYDWASMKPATAAEPQTVTMYEMLPQETGK